MAKKEGTTDAYHDEDEEREREADEKGKEIIKRFRVEKEGMNGYIYMRCVGTVIVVDVAVMCEKENC